MLVSVVSLVSLVSMVSFRSFRSFRWFRFGRFVSLFRVLVHAERRGACTKTRNNETSEEEGEGEEGGRGRVVAVRVDPVRLLYLPVFSVCLGSQALRTKNPSYIVFSVCMGSPQAQALRTKLIRCI